MLLDVLIIFAVATVAAGRVVFALVLRQQDREHEIRTMQVTAAHQPSLVQELDRHTERMQCEERDGGNRVVQLDMEAVKRDATLRAAGAVARAVGSRGASQAELRLGDAATRTLPGPPPAPGVGSPPPGPRTGVVDGTTRKPGPPTRPA